MHTTTAYHRREALTDNELENLRAALVDEVSRYKIAIAGYNTEKMRQFGEPYMAKLQAKVADVISLQQQRASKAD
ncbi:hypothetical protein EAH79_03850 [Sphingomonas koreensis]|nr:hypothetical protein EAH79_03850 [Sphingomonas koreensis]